MTRFTWAPGTSTRVPKFVIPAVMPVIVDVPLLVIFPLASGVPAVGRTLRFCHVREFVTPLLLALVMVNVTCVDVTDVTATLVPLTSPLMFLALEPPPLSRVISTAAAEIGPPHHSTALPTPP